MKIEAINVEKTIKNTKKLLDEDPNVSPTLKSSINLLLVLVTLLLNKLGLNSRSCRKKVFHIQPFLDHQFALTNLAPELKLLHSQSIFFS